MSRPTRLAIAAVAAALAAPAAAPAQDTLTIIEPSSTLVVSGAVGVNPVLAQGPGSLSTTYTGTIGVTAFDPAANLLTLSATATRIDAAVSGNWAPQPFGAPGTAPADYGGLVDVPVLIFTTTVQIAIRDAVAGFAADQPVTVTPTGPGAYSFPANQALVFLSGGADTRDTLGLTAPGRAPFDGNTGANAATAPATLQSVGGGVYELTYPVDATFSPEVTPGVFATIRLQGMLVARGSLTPVPEPALVLVACAAAGLPWLARRCRAPCT